MPRLDELRAQGTANDVPGAATACGGRDHQVEPHARGLAALHSPNTGVVDFPKVAEAFADDVRERGA